MSIQTPTQFAWTEYTVTWVIRAVGVGIVCGIVLLFASSFGLYWTIAVSIFSAAIMVGVLFWTIAEMIEDGLATDTDTSEDSTEYIEGSLPPLEETSDEKENQ